MNIQMKNIEKSFGANKVLHDATINIEGGEVHALMGENGAGKSTLMNILVGDLDCDGGEIFIDGELVNPFKNPNNRISFIRQELNLVNELSVYDNVFLGKMGKGFVKDEELIEKTTTIFDSLGIFIDPKRKVSSLSIGQQQLVEIAKGLVEECEVLIMDEPTAALTDKEIEQLFKIISGLIKKNVGIIYISHRMQEIFDISKKITVMRDGKYIEQFKTDSVSESDLIKAMVGREVLLNDDTDNRIPGKEVIRVEDISNEYLGFENISFNVREGEVVALAGLMGAKRTEILETIFNVYQPDSGEVIFYGEKINGYSIRKTIDLGIAFVTEDRKNDGLHLSFDIKTNIGMPNELQISEHKFIKKEKETKLTEYFIEKLNVKSEGVNQKVASLSGGNQQKIVIGKWLATMPKLLILDEPTRGIDVNAKHEIYKLINKLADEKLAILMVSSEMPETLLLANRIVTLNEGKQTGIIENKNLTEEILLNQMIGDRDED